MEPRVEDDGDDPKKRAEEIKVSEEELPLLPYDNEAGLRVVSLLGFFATYLKPCFTHRL